LPEAAAGFIVVYMGREKAANKSATILTDGANCPSCAYTIEHLGRKVQGVWAVEVDIARRSIRVEYEGTPGSLERIAEIVRLLGYNADIQWESVK
jgi:copper chaperone CopZ